MLIPKLPHVGEIWEIKVGYFSGELARKNRIVISSVNEHGWVVFLDLAGQPGYTNTIRIHDHYKPMD